MSTWRATIPIGGSFAFLLIVGVFVVGGPKIATAIPFPASTPVVCATGGACLEVDNTGHGVAVEGQALNKGGVGLFGLAPSTTLSGTGVLGQAFGSSSIGIKGVSFSTDASHVSVGVSGVSANGAGVKGTTTFNSAQLITAAAGVLGNDKSTAFGFDMGVEGTSTLGVGVAGVSQNGNGLTGSSSNANGVVGQTTFLSTSGSGQVGVLGQDLSTPGPLFDTPYPNAGVEGTSQSGYGVAGITSSTDFGAGVFGQSTTGGIGVWGVGRSGVIGEGINGGVGVAGYSPHIALWAQNSAPSPGQLVILGANYNSIVMTLDNTGNMILTGNLTENGTPLVAHRSPNGSGIGTYSAQQTTKTIEDLGEGQLVNGQSYIRLDAAYSSVTDTHKTYFVFLTPQGDCRGLYVTQKSPAGFAVQEMNGGRSTISFDYRIVAKSLESPGSRLPKIPPISNHGAHLPVPPLPHTRSVPKFPTRFVPVVRPGYVPSNHS